MGPPIIIPSLFLLDLLQLIRHQIQFSIHLRITPHILLQISFRIGDALFNLVELTHHAIEIIVDEILLPVNLTLDQVSIGVHHNLQRLDVAVELGDLVLLVLGGLHEVGEDAAERHQYVLLRLFLRFSYWKLFSNMLSIYCLNDNSGSTGSRRFIFK